MAVPGLCVQDRVVVSVADAAKITGCGLPRHVFAFQFSTDHVSRDIIIEVELSTVAAVDAWMLRCTSDFDDDTDPVGERRWRAGLILNWLRHWSPRNTCDCWQLVGLVRWRGHELAIIALRWTTHLVL